MDSVAKRSKAGRVRHSSMVVWYASAKSVHSGSQLRTLESKKMFTG
jgi:hypothetical protein